MAGQGTGATYCVQHKDTPTGLRCGRCETPVCPQCMVHGPVGVRCLDCGKPPKLPQFEVSTPLVLRAIGASLGLGIAGGVVFLVLYAFGLFFYLIAAAGFGYVVSEATSYAANRKRGPVLAIIAAIGAVLGHVPVIALTGLLHLILGAVIAGFIAYVRLKQP
ncbi:MAG: hypothetical protein F4X72_03690 [Dehalococcoidia bacterium]|nr:hypothetical protein [Dehalococcoidia bacterium]